ncbi:retrovirus-related pol polyprotein from transposon TNT 1-94 [Tanacetum coccineum]
MLTTRNPAILGDPVLQMFHLLLLLSMTGTVRFGYDQIVKIMGYGDYQLGNIIVSMVYYVEGLGHNLFSVGKFCDADLEVTFWKNTCFIQNLEGVDLLSGSIDTNLSKEEAPDAIIKCIKDIQVCLNTTVRNVRTDNGTEFVNQTLREFYENVGITHQTSVARTPQQNNVIERRNRTLVEVARTMLIFSKAPLFLWTEAINTTSYTQNHSLIRLRYNKTPYELMHDKKPDLSFLHVFGLLCYPTNDSEDLGKLNAKADIGIFVGYTPAKKAFRIYNRRTRKIMETIHVTTLPNPIPQQPCNPPNRDDWVRLFQPMFDEYINPPTIVVSQVPVVAEPRAVDIADSLVSTSMDQDAPSISIPSTQEQEHSLIISQAVEESPKTLHFHDDPLHESLHEDSTSQGSSSNVRPSHTPFELIGRWTKDHLIANVIEDPFRSVSTRKQL